MPAILTITVSRLVFSMRAARLRTKARQSGQNYNAGQEWSLLSSSPESHRGEGEDEIQAQQMRVAPETSSSPFMMESESDDMGEMGQQSISVKVQKRARGMQPGQSELEAGEALLGRESTQIVPQSGHQHGSTFEPPELEWTSADWLGVPAIMEASSWSPDTPVQRSGFKWPVPNIRTSR